MMRLRRSMLFIPGNSPAMLQSGGVFQADSVILDLEDAVAPNEKDAARLLVSQALTWVDYGVSETVVRINPLDTYGRADIRKIVPCRPAALMVPKVQSAADIRQVVDLVAAAEAPGQKPVLLIALLETPQGLHEAYQIARADVRVAALALGAEDYSAALGIKRTREGAEIFTARALVVNAAAAAGIEAIDTPFTDANDDAGIYDDAVLAKQFGFKGKMAINPRQVDIIHQVYNPDTADIVWAEQVIDALAKAEAEGAGVASLNGKMVDAPVAARARQILFLAQRLNLRKEMAE